VYRLISDVCSGKTAQEEQEQEQEQQEEKHH